MSIYVHVLSTKYGKTFKGKVLWFSVIDSTSNVSHESMTVAISNYLSNRKSFSPEIFCYIPMVHSKSWYCCYSYLEVRIKDGGGHNIQCPGGKCFRPIPSVSHCSVSHIPALIMLFSVCCRKTSFQGTTNKIHYIWY